MERSFCWTDWDHCSCYPHSRSLCSPLHRKEQPQGGKNACLTDSLHAEMLQVFTPTYQLSILSKLLAQTLQKVPCPLCSGHAGSVAETTPNWAVVSIISVQWYDMCYWDFLTECTSKFLFQVGRPPHSGGTGGIILPSALFVAHCGLSCFLLRAKAVV